MAQGKRRRGRLLISAAIALLGGGVALGAEVDVEALREQVQRQADLLRSYQQRLAELERSQQDAKALERRVEELARKLSTRQVGPMDFRAFWKDGLRLETSDGRFKLKLGGRIMDDWAWLDEEAGIRRAVSDRNTGALIGDLRDGTEFRRARLYMAGLMYGNIDWKLQFDFAGGTAALKDAWMGVRDLPVGHLKVGHFKEPFSLEELTSSKYITFMERALPVGTFAPSRNAGIGVSSHVLDDRVTYAVGVFRNTNASGRETSEGGYNVTGRVTWLPWCAEKGRKLLHLGLALSYRQPGNLIRYRERPEMHLAPRFVDTGSFRADDVWLGGIESALVYGPFSLQGELIAAAINRDAAASNPLYHGGYVQASCFLTGEHRRYSKKSGAFGRVKPLKNYKKGSGWGAWEAAARYSYVNLNQNGLHGGVLDDVTLGLNWYLNPHLRVMLNYVFANLHGAGKANMLGTRFQIDF